MAKRRPDPLPLWLPLLPGLKWAGKLQVIACEGAGSYIVGFDAEVVGAPQGRARFVYDRTVMDADRLAAWTGWREARP